MIPDDPLGKDGPDLDIFLRKDYRYVLPADVWKVRAQRKPAISSLLFMIVMTCKYSQ